MTGSAVSDSSVEDAVLRTAGNRAGGTVPAAKSSRRCRSWPTIARPHGAAAAVLSCAALTSLGLVAAPAAQASPRTAAADRAYPVLVDSGSASSTGMLTEIGPTWTVSLPVKEPGPIAVAPDGRYAYVATAGGIAVIGGVNTAHPKITATVKTAGTPGGIAITPNGADVYITISRPKRSLVKAYAGAGTGQLRLAASVAAEPGANAIAITPDGRYAYVAVNDVPQAYYLTEIGGIRTTHPRVLQNIGIAGYPESVTVTPNGQFVYEVSNMGLSGGALAFGHAESAHPALVRGFSPPGQGGLSPVAVTPNGRWAYAAYLGKFVVIRHAQTSPRQAGTAKAGNADGELVIQPDGRYAMEDSYRGSTGSLTVLTGTSAGHPTVAATWKLSYLPANLAISPVR
jgi:DNA-binding beta-propeller fold protein YncE